MCPPGLVPDTGCHSIEAAGNAYTAANPITAHAGDASPIAATPARAAVVRVGCTVHALRGRAREARSRREPTAANPCGADTALAHVTAGPAVQRIGGQVCAHVVPVLALADVRQAAEPGDARVRRAHVPARAAVVRIRGEVATPRAIDDSTPVQVLAEIEAGDAADRARQRDEYRQRSMRSHRRQCYSIGASESAQRPMTSTSLRLIEHAFSRDVSPAQLASRWR